mmetsp:Transcript_41279/g.90050  ORF Transcript_41279/g.90050 Transcript_41279/m.90050 type:complete len:476 (-) Transcript_41279:85-1512(-)|eukprot:CAMPEP_0204276004 /NCGR_PEP_ID=MMETSP0468-20130131/27133_1 /ASSEMBLY_ACC=CAM_ASM_000383 /TAXON_ID=2969 /ORGANISM="Oxyrrhis marina" /LENGTH=475 /DNA_ID=CAMNT_0051252485 /DNA_START=118 /DNA_END=1548 /DNA_ORIENTATION=+
MIQYNNSISALKLIFQFYGSVIPRVLPWSIFCAILGLMVSMHRNSAYLPEDNRIAENFGIQVYSMVLGYVVVFRTNMALSRYMEGISQVQIMLSKWGDAFLQLIAFANASAEHLDMEGKLQLLRFRCRQAHWFALMSAFAMLSLQLEGEVQDFDELLKQLEEKPSGTHHGDTGLVFLEDIVSPTLWQLLTQKHPQQKPLPEDGYHKFWIFHMPTANECSDLRHTPDKVISIAEWIVESAMEEWHRKHLLTPPPILSRCFQEISNASFGFNQAWKIARVPFPFPFAQILSLTLIGLVMITPFAIDQFTQSVVLTPIFSALVVMGYMGLNMIAVELENPFGGDANDLPLQDVHNAFIEVLEDLAVQISVADQPDLIEVEDRIWKRRWDTWAETEVVKETRAPEVLEYCESEVAKLKIQRELKESGNAPRRVSVTSAGDAGGGRSRKSIMSSPGSNSASLKEAHRRQSRSRKSVGVVN